MFNRKVALCDLVRSLNGNTISISMKSRWALAALLFAVVLIPSSGWASVTNCPKEPKQGVSIKSGQTYYGTNCVLSSASDIDSFQFTASAGDTWSMVTAMTTGGYPSNICLALYAPSNPTAIFSSCSDSAGNSFQIGTTQTLAVAGAYSIVVTETENAVIDYGLSLERLSPAPPDGVALVLGQTTTGGISAPTAQDAFTFYAATTGTYEIAASMTTGAYPLNLCFALYQPNGASVLTPPACTDSAGNRFTTQAEVTPTQNGTYVVVVYEEGNNATFDYNLSVSCISGTCPAKAPPPPSCLLKDALSYNATSGTLTMNFTVGTPVAATWNGWLTYQNTMQSLWSLAQPITEPPVAVTQTQAGVAKSGKVGILSTLTTPTGGITCSSWTQINTGKP
jgi:hypothetical protein